MTIRIMEQALEQMVERDAEIDKTITELQGKLDEAKAEKKLLGVAIKEQQKALGKISSAVVSQRPTTRHAPRPGTDTARVLEAIRMDGEPVELAAVCSRTDMDSAKVRPIVGDLIRRGYVRRVADGVYRAADL